MSTTRIISNLAAGCGLVILLLATGCGRSEPLPDLVVAPEPVADRAAAADVPLRRVADTPFEYSWDLPLPAPVHRAWLDPAVPELLFVQLANRHIHAIDHASGMTRWVSQEQMPAPIIYPPFAVRSVLPGERSGEEVVEDHLYVISDDWLFCLDAVYGQLVYRYHLGRKGREGFQPSTGPLAFGQGENVRIFVGDWEGRVRVISYDEQKKMAFHKWQYNLYATPTARPVGTEGIAYFGDQGGHLRAFGLRRELQWDFDTKGVIHAPPAIRGRNLYLGSDVGKLHILNRLSGTEIDGLVLGQPILRQPFWFDGEPTRLYLWLAGDRPGLQALYTMPDRVAFTDAENKYPKEVERLKKEWFVENAEHLVASSPQHLFVTRRDKNPTMIYALDRETGRFDWRWDVQGERDRNGNGEVDEDEEIAHLLRYQDRRDLVRSVFTIDRTGHVVAYKLFGQFTVR